MTLDQYLQELRSRLRLFEAASLRQQNAGQLSDNLLEQEWEKEYALFLTNTTNEGET